MNASLVNSFASLRVSARPQQPSLSFKASVGGQQLVGKSNRSLLATRIGHGMWEWSACAARIAGGAPLDVPSTHRCIEYADRSIVLNPLPDSLTLLPRPRPPAALQPRTSVVAAASMTIEAKQNSLKRQRTAEKARQYNKSRKSEIATRMKKVFTALDAYKASPPVSEADLAPVATLINEAYQVIDKAVVKGVLHSNTAARRKARLAKARRNVLISAGLYTPAN